MSKLYKKYKELKYKNPDSVILFKSGIFYIALENDAIFLSEKLGLKLSFFNNEISKCGFPVSRFSFYSHLLNELSIPYVVFDSQSSLSPYDINQAELNSVISYILSLNLNCITYRESFDILQRIQEMLKKNLRGG